jgi:hypothetical protein
MRDVVVAKAGAQFNRVSRQQLFELGLSERAIAHHISSGRLVIVEQGVFALPPVLAHDDWGRWMGATLTAPGTVLSHASAAAAWGFWSLPRRVETVTRSGSGGPRRHGGLLVFRSTTLAGNHEILKDIPITTVVRTLIDLAGRTSQRATARALRETVRLGLTSVPAVAAGMGTSPGRKGTRRLGEAIARYSGLPLERARSGSEVNAIGILRDAEFVLPRLNVRIAGEEADLSWARQRLIVEIDGGPFHLDVGEDARKESAWRGAGWTVRRIPSDDVDAGPARLLELITRENVPRQPS